MWLSTDWLHCALASCVAVYCNRSCLWVCDSGRTGGRCPNLTTASARALFASRLALFSSVLCLRTLIGRGGQFCCCSVANSLVYVCYKLSKQNVVCKVIEKIAHARSVCYRRARVSNRVTKNFDQDMGGGRGRPCKIFLTSSFITVRNLVAVSPTACAHVGGLKNFGDAVPPPHGMGRG